MTDKFQLVSYLYGLQAIMEGKEDAGRARGRRLGNEYNRVYEQLMEIINGENEEREKGADSASGKPRSSGSDRDRSGSGSG